MEGHEERAQDAPGDDGYGGPQQVAAEGDAENPYSERREVGIAREPHRPQVPDLAVPLGERHVIDRAFFDQRCVGHGHRLSCGAPLIKGARRYYATINEAPRSAVCYIITPTL